MTPGLRARDTAQKLSIFRSCFSGLPNAYGTYDPRTGKNRQVKNHVTSEVMLRHLQGRQPYGVYLLVGSKTRAVVADFDEGDAFSPMQFVRRAEHYGMSAYLERSKRKGWHAWVFMDEHGVSAAKARIVTQSILEEIEKPSTEIFPKQDRLDGSTFYGNFINAPLFGALVPKGRTVFVDPEDGLRPFPNQWDLLEDVERVPESRLDELIEVNGLSRSTAEPSSTPRSPNGRDASSTIGLSPCAQSMLANGVTANQRVACFRLALHLKKAGIPEDIAVSCLGEWATKNRPSAGKRVITENEIVEQTRWAFLRDYRSCGCEDPAVTPYCQPGCPIRQGADQGLTSRGHHA